MESSESLFIQQSTVKKYQKEFSFSTNQRILLIQYNYLLMKKESQYNKADRIKKTIPRFNSSVIQEMLTLTNSYFPFSSTHPSFPYPYPFPYAFGAPYNYFSSPYYPPYSYAASQQEMSKVSQFNSASMNMPAKDEAVESSSPIWIKAQVKQRDESQEKPILGHSIQAEKKFELSNMNQRSQYFNIKKKPSGDIELKIIFKKMIESFLSQQFTMKERLEVKKQLKKMDWQAGSDIFLESIFEYLNKKCANFKKTKEEMIKYIIRRTYHNYKISQGGDYRPELNRLERFHQRNLSIHKSMNNDFLKKQFSNKLFVGIYQEFLYQIDEQLQRENQQRIQRLAYTLSQAWTSRNIKMLEKQKRIPWNSKCKRKVKQIALDLLKEYEQKTEQPKQQKGCK